MLEKLTPLLEIKPWGGQELALRKGLSIHGKLGETWECSTLANKESMVGQKQLSLYTGELSFLIKFLETSENLSVQAHPGEAYARRAEKCGGKDECWIILDTLGDGAGIFLGFKTGVTKDSLKEAIQADHNVSAYLNFYPVKKGDFFFVPAGSIHAIGANVLLCEVQQSSGITYRVWDWNRVDDDGNRRELHVAKALDIINFQIEKNNLTAFSHSFELFERKSNFEFLHPDFYVAIIRGEKNSIISFKKREGSKFVALIALNDSLEIKAPSRTLLLKPYESAIMDIETAIDLRVDWTSDQQAFFIIVC